MRFEEMRQCDQEMVKSITPSLQMSPLITGMVPLVSRKMRRRMFLWKLAQLPGHPYKQCQKCVEYNPDTDEEQTTDVNREHAVQCSGISDWLWEKIDELKPQRYTIPDNNQVNAMDVILDILPWIHDEFVWNPHESDLDWNTRHAELLEQEYAAWKIAQLA
ncbi:hypothetical protein HK098_008272, partial [Nowakowskiella sp. JEL0407]